MIQVKGVRFMNDKMNLGKEAMSVFKSVILAIIIVTLLRQFVFTPTTVRGESMLPSLEDGNRVILSKMTTINRFDEVVFHATDSPDSYVKRVIGLPGDTVEMKNDVLYINGKAIEEPYLEEFKKDLNKSERLTEDFTLKNLTGKQKVPKGHMFVLGDNRLYSKDSRIFGFVPMNRIIGEVKLRIWPIKDIGFAK